LQFWSICNTQPNLTTAFSFQRHFEEHVLLTLSWW
jgi:hypothetical protein